MSEEKILAAVAKIRAYLGEFERELSAVVQDADKLMHIKNAAKVLRRVSNMNLGVINKLIDHAQQAVYRPGAWERGWLCQAFGDDWIQHLEPGDPHGRPDSQMFQRPKRPGGSGTWND